MLATALLLAWVGATVIADSVDPNGEWIKVLVNGGPFAVFLFLFITGRIRTPQEVENLKAEMAAQTARYLTLMAESTARHEASMAEERERSSNERKRNEELNELIRTQITPPLVELTRTLPSVVEALRRPHGG